MNNPNTHQAQILSHTTEARNHSPVRRLGSESTLPSGGCDVSSFCQLVICRRGKIILTHIAIAILLTCPLFAQQSALSPIILQTTDGTVGARSELVLLARQNAIGWGGEVRVEARLHLSNPTVWYPEEWISGKNVQLVGRALSRLNDSTWDVALTLRCSALAACDTLARLRGEVLAPSDSTTTLRFDNLRLTDGRGSRIVPSTSSVLRVQSIGAPLPFIRTPRLEQNAPNPIPRGNATTWAYRIDEPSDVTFHIYTILGQEVVRLERKNQSRGAHIETWIPETPLAAGVYYVRFRSSTGEIWQRCIIE